MGIKIIIADSYFSSRKGLSAFLRGNRNFECVADVSDAIALPVILKKIPADILIIYYCCKVCFPVNVINGIRVQHPDLKILVISHEKSYLEIRKLIDIGITNCIFHDCSEKEMAQAIEMCAKGTTSFPEQIINDLIEKESAQGSIEDVVLTQREHEIIQLIAQGLSGKEIAEKLFLSHHTVHTHRKNIMKKLHIKSTAELVLHAIRLGLISSGK